MEQRHGMPTESLDAAAMITLRVSIVLVEHVLLELIPIRMTPHCILVPTMDYAITMKVNASASQAGVAAMAVEIWVQIMIAVPDQS
jgi:hypothetical protein